MCARRQNQDLQVQLYLLSKYLVKLGVQGLTLPPTIAAIVQGEGCAGLARSRALVCVAAAVSSAEPCL
jgi:hypothetical protein